MEIVPCGSNSEPASLPADTRAPVPIWGREVVHLENQCPGTARLAVFMPMLAVHYSSGVTKPPAFRVNMYSFSSSWWVLFWFFSQCHVSVIGKNHPVSVREHISLFKSIFCTH